MDKSEIVARGVAAHAAIDEALNDARTAALKSPYDKSTAVSSLARATQASKALEAVHEDGVAAGMVPKALAAKKIIHQARMVTALINKAIGLAQILADGHASSVVDAISEAGLASAELHVEDTKIAQANGVDTGTLQSVAGVMMPMGGGDR